MAYDCINESTGSKTNLNFMHTEHISAIEAAMTGIFPCAKCCVLSHGECMNNCTTVTHVFMILRRLQESKFGIMRLQLTSQLCTIMHVFSTSDYSINTSKKA